MKFNVTGMSCAACVSRVEKAAKSIDGVKECSVSLLTNSMRVEGDIDENRVIEAVAGAGYGATVEGKAKKKEDDGLFKDTETPRLKKRLVSSLFFLILLMYISMGHNMWHFPLPQYFENNPAAIGLLQLIICAIVLIINKKFFINGIKGALHRSPNMDTLVALGSGASFIYSLVVLFLMLGADKASASEYLHTELYFESSAMILVLITVGKLLEAHSKGKTTSALKELIKLKPRSALVLENGVEREIDIDQLKVGDEFIVKAGNTVPTDAVIVSGGGAFDEAALSGESIPVDKEKDDKIFGGTSLKSGYIVAKAERVGEETTLSGIIRAVGEAVSTKAPIARIADYVSGIFVPSVILIALITTVVWLIFTGEAGYSLARGISVLVISCPCALGLATPVAIMVGSGVGAKNGILFKNAKSLEALGSVKVVALDKTGTITKGEPRVCDIIPYGLSEGELMTYAYALELRSEHPLGRAIVLRAQEMGIEAVSVDSFETLVGSGVKCKIDGEEIVGASYKYVSSVASLENSANEEFEALSRDGKTPLFFLKGEKLIGIIAVRDEIKEDSREAISDLKKMGIKTVMLTGDNENSARAIGKITGVDEVISEVLPEGKEAAVTSLKKYGRVAMVGDGINDAVALASADVGIAVGNGTDVAMESAQVVLMKNSLRGVSKAIKLSKKTLINIKENLFWAFIYNCIGIPLAAGVFIPLTGWEMSPMLGALAMSLSSFCVVTNALRLNLVKLDTKKEDEKETDMATIIKVDGMMCSHCEARVSKTALGIEGVKSAVANHKKGTLTLEGEFDPEKLKTAIREQGYTVK